MGFIKNRKTKCICITEHTNKKIKTNTNQTHDYNIDGFVNNCGFKRIIYR